MKFRTKVSKFIQRQLFTNKQKDVKITCTLKYGIVYASSENLEGIAKVNFLHCMLARAMDMDIDVNSLLV